MKSVSADKSHIDFTDGNSGVRVWKHQCQAIYRIDETSDWIGRGDIVPVRVPDSILGFPHAGIAPVNALAAEVARYDNSARDPELRALLKGWTTFEEALDQEDR